MVGTLSGHVKVQGQLGAVRVTTVSGNVEVGRAEELDVRRISVDVAGPGEVLLSDATRSQIDDRLPDVAFEELDPVVMKGIPQPVRLYRALR